MAAAIAAARFLVMIVPAPDVNPGHETVEAMPAVPMLPPATMMMVAPSPVMAMRPVPVTDLLDIGSSDLG